MTPSAASNGEPTMRTTMLTLLGAALMAAATFQAASATDRHHVRKADRALAPVSQPVRNSSADLWPAQLSEPDWHRYPGQ
jgi:hypothetical protein